MVVFRLKSGEDWPSEALVSATAFQLRQKSPPACALELCVFITAACDNMGSFLRTCKAHARSLQAFSIQPYKQRFEAQRKHPQSYLGSLMHSMAVWLLSVGTKLCNTLPLYSKGEQSLLHQLLPLHCSVKPASAFPLPCPGSGHCWVFQRAECYLFARRPSHTFPLLCSCTPSVTRWSFPTSRAVGWARDAWLPEEPCCTFSGHGLAGMVVLGWRLDFMSLEVFSKLYDSMILWVSLDEKAAPGNRETTAAGSWLCMLLSWAAWVALLQVPQLTAGGVQPLWDTLQRDAFRHRNSANN